MQSTADSSSSDSNTITSHAIEDSNWCLEERVPPDGEEDLLPRMSSNLSLCNYESLQRSEIEENDTFLICGDTIQKDNHVDQSSSKTVEDSDVGSEHTLDSCIEHSDGESLNSRNKSSSITCDTSEYEYLRAKLLSSYRQEVAKCYQKLKFLKLRISSKSISLALRRRTILRFPSISEHYLPNVDLQNKAVLKEVSTPPEQSGSSPLELEKPIGRYLKFDGEFPYKIYKVRLGHLEGIHQRILLLLSSHAVYLLQDEHPLKRIKDFIPYEDIEACIVSCNRLWFVIIRKNIHSPLLLGGRTSSDTSSSLLHIDVGDSELAGALLNHLEISIRRRLNKLFSKSSDQDSLSDDFKIELKAKMELLSGKIYVKSTQHSSPRFIVQEQLLPRFIEFKNEFYYAEIALRQHLGIKNNLRIYGCWHILWENGSLANMEESSKTVCGPHLEGHLMMKKPGIFSVWKPSFFILKAGVLYQFSEASVIPGLPETIIPIEQCNGCTRLSSISRPHAFQLLRKKEPPLLLAAPDDGVASQWLQAFVTLINNKELTIQEDVLLPCQLVLANFGLILCHHFNLIKIVYSMEKNLFSRLNERKKRSTQPCKKVLPRIPSKSALFDGDGRDKASAGSLNQPNIVTSLSRAYSAHRNSPLKVVQHGRCISDSPLKQRISNKIETGSNLSSKPISDANGNTPKMSMTLNFASVNCPPTPPRLKLPPVVAVNPPKDVEESKMPLEESFKILSTGYFDQINQICIDPQCPEACIVEYECSEALEVVGDWAIYFRTPNQLEGFLSSLTELWMPLYVPNKDSQNLSRVNECVNEVTSTAVHNFLLKGTLTSQRMWNGC